MVAIYEETHRPKLFYLSGQDIMTSMTDSHLKYASKIPKEIRLAINGMSGQNELRYGILMLLVEEDELKFNEIKSELDSHPQTLSNALDDLQTGGLLEKQSGEKIGVQSTGKYTITSFGDRILEGLYHASQPTSRAIDTEELSSMISRIERELSFDKTKKQSNGISSGSFMFQPHDFRNQQESEATEIPLEPPKEATQANTKSSHDKHDSPKDALIEPAGGKRYA